MGNDGTISMTWRSFPDGLWTWLSPIPANIREKFRSQTSDNKGIALDLGPKAFDLGSQFWLALLLYIFVVSIELGT